MTSASRRFLICTQMSTNSSYGWKPLASIPEPMHGSGEGETHRYTGTAGKRRVTGTPCTNLHLCLGCGRRSQYKETILASPALCWGSSNNLKNSVTSGKMQRKAQGCLCFFPCTLWHGEVLDHSGSWAQSTYSLLQKLDETCVFVTICCT